MKKAKKSGKVTLPLILLAVIVLSMAFSAWSNPQIAPVKMEKNSVNPWVVKTGETLIAADQGGAKLKPENTMKAFNNAVKNSDAQMLKVDVRMTKDGVAVACRSSVLNKTSDAGEKLGDKFAKVRNYTYSELCTLNFGYKFKDRSWNRPYRNIEGGVPNDLKIVRISELLDFLKSSPQTRIMFNIPKVSNDSQKAVDSVCSAAVSRKMTSRVILKAADWSTSKYIEYRYPEFSRTANTIETVKFYFMCQFKRDLSSGKIEYESVVLPQRLGLVTVSTQKIVNYGHNYYIAVQYDNINSQSKIDYLKSIGADAVITEIPELSASK